MYSQQFKLCHCLVKSLLLRICLGHQPVIPFLSGAPPREKNPVFTPVLFLLAVREKSNSANLNKFAACGVWAVQVTTLYSITPCCVCIFFFYSISSIWTKNVIPHGIDQLFLLPFYRLQLVKSLHFHVPEAWKTHVKPVIGSTPPGNKTYKVQSNPAISKSLGKWEKVRNSGASK